MALTLRVLAFPLVLALVSQAALPVTEYICKFTGARMTVCCCEPAAQGAVAFERACCCDIRIIAGVLDPRAVDGAKMAPVSSAAIIVERSAPWLVSAPWPGFFGADDTLLEKPPDRGRPAFLLHHRLLI